MSPPVKNELTIVLAGEAGHGIQAIELILIRVLKNEGYHVFSTKEYMSRVRGGINSTTIRVSSRRVTAYSEKVDLLIVLDQEGIPHLKERISEETLVIGESDKIHFERLMDFPLTRIAAELGSPLYSNTVAAGLIAGLLKVGKESAKASVMRHFHLKSVQVQNDNALAFQKGHRMAEEFFAGKISVAIDKSAETAKEAMLSGVDGIALGAMAGGCDFVCGYPMTPSTEILSVLARFSRTYELIVEQAEDEIAAVNMALGAWYAGARAFVCTAGGGFSLMGEGISLCGMTESPLVVSVGMRPAPATGMPTRTEQGDLHLVLYAGHGVFPRIIYAPGNVEEAFALTRKAFFMADRYQVPVFILSDQYLIDTFYNLPDLPIQGMKIQKEIVLTEAGYQRYRFTESGLSPRGIPGHGEGRVCLDSDEHDEEGRITESMEMRRRMVDKRMEKEVLIQREISPPELYGREDFTILVVGWGSTRNMILEALEKLGREEIAFLHYSELYPFPKDSQHWLRKAKKRILVENNKNGEFGALLFLSTGIEMSHQILKYDGLPFSVEELAALILKGSG